MRVAAPLGETIVAEEASIRYRAFVSYSHRDSTWARWLHKALEGYAIDKDLVGRDTPLGPVPKTLRPIFRDREDFSAGHSLSEQTIAALAASQFLIVVCSPRAAQSKYVDEEIRRFKALGRADHVIAVIVDGEPNDPARECFPPALRGKVGADGVLTGEREDPIAADLRRQGDGKVLAVQKAVARLIGVSLDEVRRRAVAAWRRKTTIATLAGLCAAVLLIVSGYLAWHAERLTVEAERHEVRDDNRDRTLNDIKVLTERLISMSQAQAAPGAERAVGEAVTAAAEGAARGDARLAQALDLLKAGKTAEAATLFRTVAEEREKAAASAGREAAAAYRNLGAIAGLADPKHALDAYRKAVELDPDDHDSLFWVAWIQKERGVLDDAEPRLQRLLAAAKGDQYQYWARLGLGDILVEHGDLHAARAIYGEARLIAERLAKANPDDAGWQRVVSVSYNKIGDVLVAQGNLPEALKSFRGGLTIAERLAKAAPNNAGRQSDLSVSYNKIGDVLVKQGNLPEALKSFRDGLAIREPLAKADPNNAIWQRDLSVSYDRIGDVLVAQGKLPEALTSFRKGLAIAEQLASADPDNEVWQRDLTVSYDNVADVLVKQGNLLDALKSFRRSLAIRERLATADLNNVGRQRDLTASYDRIGDVLVAQGNLSEALQSFREGLAITDRLAKADTKNADWQHDLSISYSKIGGVLLDHGMFEDALRYRREALAIHQSLARLDPSNDEWRRDLSAAYNELCWSEAIVGQLQAALKDCTESLGLRPEVPDTLDSRGFTFLKMGQFENAIADYDAALRLAPKNPESLYGRGLAKLKKGDAIGNADIEAAIVLKPSIAAEFERYGVTFARAN
jgi:tetratricopeptide (TPR) repeat protein